MADEKRSRNGEDMAAELPSFMPSDPSSPNHKLLDVVGHAIDDLDDDIEAVNKATSVRNAESIDQLFEVAKLVGVNPKTHDTLGQYRSRVFTRFALMTGEGTIEDLLEATARVLGVSISSLQYREDLTNGVLSISVPSKPAENLGLTPEELRDVINDNVFAGYRVEISLSGTFTYITPEDYEDAAFSHDPDLGYSGLDENDEPNGNGGTYAGYLE